MNRPDIGLCFTAALEAELARYRAADRDEPGEPDEPEPEPALPAAREFARALREALAAEPEPESGPGARDGSRAEDDALATASSFEQLLRQHLDSVSATATWAGLDHRAGRVDHRHLPGLPPLVPAG